MRQTSWPLIFITFGLSILICSLSVASGALTSEKQARARQLISSVVVAINKSAASNSMHRKRQPAHSQRVEIDDEGKPMVKEEFQTSGCDNIPSSKWLSLLISDEPIRHTFKFKKGCDIEGTLAVSKTASPVDLELRHLPGITHVKALVEPEIEMLWSKRLMSVTLNATRGEFFKQSQSVMQFDADYNVAVGLSGELEKNNGGAVDVRRFEGQTMRLNAPFRIE